MLLRDPTTCFGVIKLFSCSTRLSIFQLLLKVKMNKKKITCLRHSDDVFILLISVVGILTYPAYKSLNANNCFKEQGNFMLTVKLSMKKFYNLRPVIE